MKKTNSLNKYSHGYLFSQFKETLSRRVLCRLLCFLITFLSVHFHAQKSIISGVENLHISGSAVIVEDSKDSITIITSHSITTYTKQKKENFENKPTKTKLATHLKKEPAKKPLKEILKKSNKNLNTNFVYNKEGKSNSSFLHSKTTEKQGITNSSNSTNTFLKSEFHLIVFFKNNQMIKNILYIFYHSKKIDNSLFARPPPSSYFI